MTIRNRIARLEATTTATDDVPPIWWQICTPEYDGPVVASDEPKPDWLTNTEAYLVSLGLEPTQRNVRRALGQRPAESSW